MTLHFAYAYLAYTFLPIITLLIVYRVKFYKTPYLSFPLAGIIAQHGLTIKSPHKLVFFILRTATLLGLLFLIMRPQWVDERSRVNVHGIDIILDIDVSDSMQVFDDLKDQRSRISVAKQEALRFIEKRIDDPIGIVIFGREVLSWCPLTLDKHILKEMVGNINLGIIDPAGTWLGTGLATAVNRLRTSQAKSKIIILLTDGQPSPGEKIDPHVAADMAKKLGIKIYTIGIGSENGGYIMGPFSQIMAVGQNQLNIELLKQLAEKTGGKFFRAKNPADMRAVYDTIDRLEKTEHQTDIFHRYYEAFSTFIWFVLLLIFLELLLKLWIWRGVY